MMLPSTKRGPTALPDVMTVVCNHFAVDPAEVMGRSRATKARDPRLVFCFLARHHTTASFPEIGSFLNRDHSTVQSAVQRVSSLRRREPRGDVSRAVSRCSDILNGAHVNTRAETHATIERWRGSLSQVAQSGLSDHDVTRLVDMLLER